MPANFSAANLADVLPKDATILVQGCSSESGLLADAVAEAGDALGKASFTGIQVPGVNRRCWAASLDSRFSTYFMTPELARIRDRVTFLPLCYADILRHLRATTIDAALFSVSPPDADGLCSFGPTVDFLAELWPGIPLRIAHINPDLPRTASSTAIPFHQLTAVTEASQRLPEVVEPVTDATTGAIAAHVASFVEDGATLQTGLGKVPGAILRVLRDRRRLRLHTGLIGDAAVDLLQAGAVERGGDIVTGVALGTRRLYDALPGSGIRFEPVSHTHDPRAIAARGSLVAINSALEVDLYGQAYAEAGPEGWMSGPGGASDFARAAAIGDGLRIVALPSTARHASRIVAPCAARGPVSLGRFDVDVVVTEYGAADLRGLGHDARAAAVVAIAAPEHRERLARAWREGPGRY